MRKKNSVDNKPKFRHRFPRNGDEFNELMIAASPYPERMRRMIEDQKSCPLPKDFTKGSPTYDPHKWPVKEFIQEAFEKLEAQGKLEIYYQSIA